MNPELPYAHLTEEELDALIEGWVDECEFDVLFDEAAAQGMVVTDLDAWESEAYDRWCEKQDRLRRGEAA